MQKCGLVCGKCVKLFVEPGADPGSGIKKLRNFEKKDGKALDNFGVLE